MVSPKLIICISGLRGSGKAALSRTLRRKYGIKDVHISYVANYLAKKAGLTIQEFMSRLIKAKGKEGIAEIVAPIIARAAGKSGVVVVQGIYKPEELIGLKRAFPSSAFYTAYVEAPKKLRIQRVAKRDGISESEAKKNVEKKDQQRIDEKIVSLMRIMDSRIRNNQDIRTLFRRFDGRLNKTARKKSIQLRKIR